MLNGHIPGLTDATAGCTISKTGLCKDCPRFISMPFDVRDPRTGDVIKTGTTYDCVDVWAAMGSWDAANQSIGIHAAVSQQTNETLKRQDKAVFLLEKGEKRDKVHQSFTQEVYRKQLNTIQKMTSIMNQHAAVNGPGVAVIADEERPSIEGPGRGNGESQ